MLLHLDELWIDTKFQTIHTLAVVGLQIEIHLAVESEINDRCVFVFSVKFTNVYRQTRGRFDLICAYTLNGGQFRCHFLQICHMQKLATSCTALHSAYFYFWIWWESKNVRQKKIVDSLQSILSVLASCSYKNRMQRLQTSFATRITTMKIKVLLVHSISEAFSPIWSNTLCLFARHVLLLFLYRRLFCWFCSLLSVFFSFSSCWLSLTLSLNFPHFQTRALYQCLAFYYSILFHIYLLYQKFPISYFSRLSSFARPSLFSYSFTWDLTIHAILENRL